MDTIVQVENIGCMLLNYEGLGAKISKLKLCQEHIKARARDIEAILSNVRLPFEAHTQVTEWIERQKKATEESEQLYQDFESCRWFNVVNFVQLWLQTNELTRVFDSLSTTGQFSEGLTKRTTYTDKTQNLTTKFVGHKFEAYKRMVCEWLEKGSVIAIGGICGMGGIGKTALLEDLYYTNESNPDYRIVWITASKDFNITKFQDDVARTLEIYPLVGNDLKRRVELLKTFKLIKNLVIIIDDLWDWISLYELGIPIGENGCRVIISTRSMKVCQAMKCQKIIKMVPLAEEESWELFMEKYGTIQPDAEVYAKDLVSKCNGLPLGVIQLALHMIGVRDTYEWKDVLHRTESLIVDNHPLQKVFEVFQCSYESLIDPQLKKCFLFCSLFPKDFLIEREMLIDCFINEGLIGRMESKLVEICTGHIVLNKLESTFLLDSVNETGKQYVKMHSLLRDFAIQVVKSLDIDRKTDNNPEELMAAYGKWANTVAKKLHPGGTSYKFLSEEGIQKQNLEKLIWIAAFMLVGARHPGTTVGAVEKEYRSEVSSLIKELASAAAAEKKLVFEETMVERLCAYSRAVAHVPTALKEFESRNGWFYSLSEKAIAEGKPDPCPLHTAWLKELKIV